MTTFTIQWRSDECQKRWPYKVTAICLKPNFRDRPSAGQWVRQLRPIFAKRRVVVPESPHAASRDHRGPGDETGLHHR